MIKILIADDHAVVREGLKQILSERPDMRVIAEASSGHEVLDLVDRNNFDVVVLDIAMPGRGGLDILKEIKNKKPRLPVLILSIYPEELYAVRVLKAGASGYITKESAPHELINAINHIARGKKYISPSLAEKLALDLEIATDRPLHNSLSDREFQVMCMIASGKTLKEIAQQLSLSIKTISTYRSRILEKMNMKSNAELTHYAIKKHLVD
ncbi:MAG: response regulator transcription factor [Nitrospirae bacterium]|nr:response regulator transcription factor [Nitrospirota bacterium]